MVQPDLSIVYSYLVALYGQPAGDEAFERLRAILSPYRDLSPSHGDEESDILSERDSVLITYADQLSGPDTPPFQTLTGFCEQYLSGLINSIHLLPFFPYSSDDGFSVIDYRAVTPEFGDWEDVSRLARNFRLMFDAVINHV